MKKLLLLVLITGLMASGIYAFAQNSTTTSNSVRLLPDSPFYFIKAWNERIIMFFTLGAENKAKQSLRLAEVRLAEYQKLMEKGKTDIAEKTLQKYNEQMNRALAKFEEVKAKGKDMENLAKDFNSNISRHAVVLMRNLSRAPEAAKKGLQNAVESSSKVLNRVAPAGSAKKSQVKDFCGTENVAEIYSCGKYIRVISSLLGGGSKYYFKDTEKELTCPVVAPEYQTQECKDLLKYETNEDCEKIDCAK